MAPRLVRRIGWVGLVVAAICGLLVLAFDACDTPAPAPEPPSTTVVVRTTATTATTTTSTSTTTTLPTVDLGAIQTIGRVWQNFADAKKPHVVSRQYPSSYLPCGGDYPPCWRVRTESSGNYGAYNSRGCGGNGCYGKWQFSGAWACQLGLPCNIRNATPTQQDNAARVLWDHGRGCSNWDAC